MNSCGFFGVACIWWVRRRRIGAVVRAGTPVDMKIPIRPVRTRSSLEPGVFGVFRPVLLLPEGIFERLAVDQLEAVIAHIRCDRNGRESGLRQ